MKTPTALTTGDIAAHCHVCYETVANWIKSGRLRAYSTPGGHRRVRRRDFEQFLRDHEMPPLEDVVDASPQALTPLPRKHRLLIVDDEPTIVQLIADTFDLTSDQYELATAGDGFEAGLLMGRFNPDLVILDLMMPKIDGFKVCQTIKGDPDTQDIIILIVTGFAQEDNIQRARTCGADDWMSKPFSPPKLKERVDRLLEERAPSRLSENSENAE